MQALRVQAMHQKPMHPRRPRMLPSVIGGPAGCLCLGAMGDAIWTRRTWQRHLTGCCVCVPRSKIRLPTSGRTRLQCAEGGSALCVCANDTVIRAKQTTIDNKNNLSISIKDTRFARLFVDLT